ncbi:MAG: TerB family tellurite resistance protein [Alphaproteobacteria bacterium]
MLDSLKSFLNKLTGEAAPAHHFDADDTRLAVAALMVHCMAVDGTVSEDERKLLQGSLSSAYDLSQSDVAQLIADATDADYEAVDLYRFTSVLKRQMDRDQRADVVEQLWSMVYADGQVHEFEDNLVWRVAELLGVERTERLARKLAARNNGAGQEND